MSIFDEIERDRNRHRLTEEWTVKIDRPMPGWVTVIGPAVSVSCPTIATDLNGQDFVDRHRDARRIARVPQLDRIALAARELAKSVDAMHSESGLSTMHTTQALAAFKEAAQ